MLFSIKNRLVPSLCLLLALVAGCLVARAGLRLVWRITPYPSILRDTALGLGCVLAGDALVHSSLTLLAGDRYRSRYHALAGYFCPQGPLEIGGGALLAGGEELFFRGVLLEGLMNRASLGAGIGLVVSALAFGALHWIRDARLTLFALWAVWEGVVLGGVYLAFGSLLVSIIVHTAHDLVGFTLLAWDRQIHPADTASAVCERRGPARGHIETKGR
jgi:membrane protease YdiL (CAAX protease family)